MTTLFDVRPARLHRLAELISVSDPDLDPDPYWIRIQSDHWIRIRIRNLNTDPDPGGQKWPTKVEKIHVLKCWMASFVSWRLLL